jgi:D-3-phosphoglycerate dehydrogenase
MRILVADALEAAAVDALTERGHTVELDAALDHETLPAAVAGQEVLVVRSTRVSAETIRAGDELSLVIRAGAGVNTIDVAAAADAGVYVANVPGRNAVAVAELTLGLLLAVDRRIPDNVADLRAGIWNKKEYATADGILGKSFGVVGLGAIGLAVAERAKAFGVQLVAQRRPGRGPATEDRIASLGFRLVDDLDTLLADSDIVSIHLPATADTAGLFDGRLLGLLKPTAILLNTSRGDIVDGDALLAALDRGVRAGLDVYPDEPGAASTRWRSAVAAHPNVVGTHHIGASTGQAQRAIADGVVEIIDGYARGEVPNCVNLARDRLGNHTINVRHFDRVGVLAAVLDILRRGNLNVEQMENRIFTGSHAAVATIELVGDVPPGLLDAVRNVPDVIHVSIFGEGRP